MKPAKSAPGVRTTLKPPRGKKPIVLLLSGAHFTIDGVAQNAASPAEAKKRFDAFVRDRTKEGFSIGSIDVVDDEPPPESEEYVHVEDEGESAEAPTVEIVDGRWRLTFLGLEKVSERTCRELVARLASDAPRVVQVICDFASPGDAWPKALGKRTKLSSVKDFVFDTYFQTQTRQAENSLGDLRATIDACPELERLFATGDLAITRGTHAKLQELHALGNPLSPSFLRALAKWKLPALELLALSLASDAAPGDDDAALEAVSAIDAPALRTVHLDGLADVPRVLEALVATPRFRDWKIVRLDGGIDEDAILDVVERHAGVFAKLDTLGLPLGDELSSDGDERLRAMCPAIRDLSELPSLTLPSAYDDWRG